MVQTQERAIDCEKNPSLKVDSHGNLIARLVARMGHVIRTCLLLSTVVLMITGCASVLNANQATKNLSVLNLPIGEHRSTTLPLAETLWGSQASCDTIRTGVGLTRRAYFLETCVFSNPPGNTLYNEPPTTVIYRFLENQLVQVSYEFSNVSDPEKFRSSALEDAKKLDAKYSDSNDASTLGLDIAEDLRVTVSDVNMVDQIHALRKAL